MMRIFINVINKFLKRPFIGVHLRNGAVMVNVFPQCYLDLRIFLFYPETDYSDLNFAMKFMFMLS